MYHPDDSKFKGYKKHKDYIKKFAKVLQKLKKEKFYDPELADLYKKGDPAAPPLPPKP